MLLKQELFQKVTQHLNDKLLVLQGVIKDQKINLESETKSSAGDKHETGRAMMQLERENTGKQLAEIQSQFQILNRLQVQHTHTKVILGSIVFTTLNNYFISVGSGLLKVRDQEFYAISMNSPMAQQLLGKSKNDKAVINGRKFVITKII